jgi:ribosome maturation factor RimP
MDECARLNREIGSLLDEKEIIQSRYVLEVSSPGLDRPLKTKEDFTRFINREVRFFLNDYINQKLEWDGLIDRVGQESLFIKVKSDIIEIPFLKINKAKLII